MVEAVEAVETGRGPESAAKSEAEATEVDELSDTDMLLVAAM
jgi:hypothetical protein